MATKRQHFFLTTFLIIVVCANLFNVGSVSADGETPTEPPVATEVVTEPTEIPTEEATEVPTELPVEETQAVETLAPSEATPIPEEATATPIAEILTQVPESTEVVVLDEEGNSVPLATAEAAEIVQVVDPMWCPEGVLPGGPGCTTNFSSISALITNMVTSTNNYLQNGVIYFTSNPGSGTFNLSPTTLPSGDFETLNDFNLTLQGGWNGDTVAPSFSGQTSFGTSPITIGTSANPWAGNITLNDITFAGASQTPITVYTTTGNITLNNVDVSNQGNGNNTALLNSASGNITVTEGTFDGNGTNSTGFSATTGAGSITITDSSFTENKIGAGTTDGATLSASTVTLTNVNATGNDGDGITINNASVVTLNNVVATNNGTDPAGPGNNDGSGVLINGMAGSNIFVNGGNFSSNKEYGIEVGNPADTTIYIISPPSCEGNVLGCSNDDFVVDATGPIITPNINGTAGSGGWYTSDVMVTWSVDDPESGIASSTGCTEANVTSETLGSTFTCFATNKVGLSGNVSVTIKVDKAAPVLFLPSNISITATGPSGATVSYSASAIDDMDSSVSVICSPASGSTFGLGTTTVNCSATDEAGHASSGNFLVTVTKETPTATVTATATATITATSSPTSTSTLPTNTPVSSTSESNSSELVVPVIDGLIDLECDSVVSAFGIKLSFINLCDQQATVESASSLPGKLPGGFTLVSGLDVKILNEGEILPSLPQGTGIQLDFSIPDETGDPLAVLYWDGRTWVEITQTTGEENVSTLVDADTANELYHIESSDDDFYKILTTEKIGTFVLVKK